MTSNADQIRAAMRSVVRSPAEQAEAAVKAGSAIVKVGTVTELTGEKLDVYLSPNGGALIFGHLATAVALDPETLAALLTLLAPSRVGVPERMPVPASHYCDSGNCEVCGDGTGDGYEAAAILAASIESGTPVTVSEDPCCSHSVTWHSGHGCEKPGCDCLTPAA